MKSEKGTDLFVLSNEVAVKKKNMKIEPQTSKDKG
jgi:hypothetical protein